MVCGTTSWAASQPLVVQTLCRASVGYRPMVPPIYTYCTKSYVTGTDIDFDDATMYGKFHQVLKFGFARNHADASTIAAQSTNDTLMSRVWWPLNKCDLVNFSKWGNVSENFITTWEIEAEVFENFIHKVWKISPSVGRQPLDKTHRKEIREIVWGEGRI